MKDKELEKLEKYQLLKDDIAKLWCVRKVIVVPVVVGALGAVLVSFKEYHEANRREREVGSYLENNSCYAHYFYY